VALRRAGFDPVYDRGQLFVDLALMLILGGETISDFQGLRGTFRAGPHRLEVPDQRFPQVGNLRPGLDRHNIK
jgi:hypothetical protein